MSSACDTAEPRFRDAARVSLSLILIALVIFVPEELSFQVFGFRLSWIRFVLFLLTPVLAIRLGQLIATGKSRLLAPDIFVVLTGAWMIGASTAVSGLEDALHHHAAGVAEISGSYLATRVLLSQRGQALSYVNLLCHVIAVVALFSIPDALMGGPVTHDLLGQVFVNPERRWGIVRASGPLEHPILFGMTCTIGFLLAVASQIRAKRLTMAACGVGTFLSLSGAPMQGAVLGLGLFAYNRFFASVRYRWWLLIATAALAYEAAGLFSSQPLAFVLGHFLFDADSFWSRVYQWNTVGPIVLNSPWVGIGVDLREKAAELSVFVTGSVDSLWLYQALTYGIPASILLGLSMISVIVYPASGSGVNLTREESKLATTLGVVIALIVLLGFTVDLWGSSWMLAGLLMGIRVHLVDLGRTASPETLMMKRQSYVGSKKDGHVVPAE